MTSSGLTSGIIISSCYFNKGWTYGNCILGTIFKKMVVEVRLKLKF